MTAPTRPAPGSLAARDQGCACTVDYYRSVRIVHDERCPMHARVASAVVTDTGECRDPQPVRASGDAWGCP